MGRPIPFCRRMTFTGSRSFRMSLVFRFMYSGPISSVSAAASSTLAKAGVKRSKVSAWLDDEQPGLLELRRATTWIGSCTL